MNGFRTGRALVIDDDPKEALIIIRALSELGVACFYADGQATPDELLTKTKLEGVRLLVLDMVLNPSITDEKQCASMVISQISGLIDHKHEPIVLVCWTNRQEMSQKCFEAFKESFPDCPCNSPIVFNKDTFADKPAELVAQIDLELRKHEPITLLYSWEQRVHDAATTTTGILSELIAKAHVNFKAEDQAATWAGSAFRVLGAMALAEGGTRLGKAKQGEAVSALYGCLNPLLLDRLEHSPIPVGVITEEVLHGLKAAISSEIPPAWKPPKTATDSHQAVTKAELNISSESEPVFQSIGHKDEKVSVPMSLSDDFAEPAHLSTDVISHINRMLLLSSQVGATACPGNIFLLQHPCENCSPFRQASVFDAGKLISDTIIMDRGATPPCDFIMEFTPSCDYVQGKVQLPRFIAGLLVKLDKYNIREARFIKSIGPLRLSFDTVLPDDNYIILLNCHYIFGLKTSLLDKLKPNMRLRQSVLNDVMAWATSEMARPGFSSLGTARKVKPATAATVIVHE